VARLALEPLTSEAFAAFGDVLDARAPCERFAINDGRTQRHHAISRVQCAAGDDSVIISVFRATPVDADFTLTRLERHPLGSQAFISLGSHPYAVVVAPPGELDESRIRGFLAQPSQGVNYHMGTWHHYLLALEAASDFVVIDRAGAGDNCDEQALATPLRMALAS
jgi:ureidoglycolate lyase